MGALRSFDVIYIFIELFLLKLFLKSSEVLFFLLFLIFFLILLLFIKLLFLLVEFLLLFIFLFFLILFLLLFFFFLIFLLHVLLLEVFLKVFHLLLSSSRFLLSGTSKKSVQGESGAGGHQEEREQHLEKFHFVLSCSAVAVLCVDQCCKSTDPH